MNASAVVMAVKFLEEDLHLTADFEIVKGAISYIDYTPSDVRVEVNIFETFIKVTIGNNEHTAHSYLELCSLILDWY